MRIVHPALGGSGSVRVHVCLTGERTRNAADHIVAGIQVVDNDAVIAVFRDKKSVRNRIDSNPVGQVKTPVTGRVIDPVFRVIRLVRFVQLAEKI